jgi:hypothetical protein
MVDGARQTAWNVLVPTFSRMLDPRFTQSGWIDALSGMTLEQMPAGLVAAVNALTGVEETGNSGG